MSLGTLTIDLAANVAGLESDLGKAQRVWDKNARDFQRTAASVAKVTAGVAAAVTVGFAAMVKSSIDTADQMSKSSAIVGVQIEKLSGLRHAADLSGVSFEQLEGGLNKFNKQVADAAEGVGAGAEAFDQLGISVQNTDGSLKDNYTLIEEVAEALSRMEDGANKSAIAQDLFGKSGAKLIPLLNGGKQGLQEFAAEAARLNKVFTADQGRAAERFNDNLSRLKDSITGLSNVVAGQVADDLADFTDVFADPDFQSGVASIASGIINIGTAAANAVKEMTIFGRVLGEEIARITNGIDISNLVDVEDQIEKVKSALESPSERIRFFGKDGWVEYYDEEELNAELTKLLAQRDALLKENPAPPIIGSQANNPSPSKSSFSEYETGATDFIDREIEARAKLQKQIEDSFRAQNEGYARQIALSGEITELDRVRYKIANGSLKGIDEKQKIILENQAREIDNIRLATQATADRKAIEDKLIADLEAARGSLLTQEEALTKAAEDRLKVFEAAYAAGKIGAEEYGELVRKNGEELNKSLDDLKEKTTDLSEITKELYRGVQNSIADAIVTGIKGGSDNALEAFRDLLIRMAAEAAAANITQWIFGGGQTGGGGSGQGANTVGWINMAASLFGGGLAVGGPAYAGKMYEVGENNTPELFHANGRQYMIPGNGGSVTPAGGGGGVVLNFDMRGASNSREIRESAGAVARKASAAINAAQRYN